MPLSPGTRLGPYKILAPIGAGGMGEVHKAQDTRLGRIVALKVTKNEFSERFEREARAVAALNHSNICQLYDVGPNYLVMEYIEGAPIKPTENCRKLLEMAVQIADGLAAAHKAGIIHRDLKPDNILLTRDGRVKILDFGIAKAVRSQAMPEETTRTIGITDPGTTIGTVAYMSPEQARGNVDLTAQSDQFSFGLVLYELATGKRAFQRDSQAEVMAAIIRDDADPVPATIPAPLRWIIERLLSKEPSERYDSTQDLYRELRQLRDRLSEQTAGLQAITTVKRTRIVPLMLAAACFAAGAMLGWLLLRSSGQDLSIYRFTPLARESASEIYPQWSPDGKSIVYTAAIHGIAQVFTRLIGSPDAAQLTNAAKNCFQPFWSRDGSTIYYISERRLWAVPASGGAPVIALEDAMSGALHPDGKTMAFQRKDKMWVGALGSGDARILWQVPPPNVVQWSTFSPDGSKLAVNDGNDLWVVPFPSGKPRKIDAASGLGTPYGMSWFPDSRHLLMVGISSNLKGCELYALDVVNGSRRVIHSAIDAALTPAVSPDGTRIVYAAGSVEWDAIEISLASGGIRTVLTGGGWSTFPDWAPSGTHFLVSSNRYGAAAIEDRSPSQGFTRRLIEAAPGRYVDQPKWAPDGARFVFRSGIDPARAVLVLSNAAGGPQVAVDPAAELSGGASWSPDGRWIAYIRVKEGTRQIAKMSPGSATPVIFSTAPPPVFNEYTITQWSPSGDWIVYSSAAGISLISPDGKSMRRLSSRRFLTFGFSKDGRRMYGVFRSANPDSAEWQLFGVDVNTGAERLLAPVDLPPITDNIAGFSLHPDGKRFLTSINKWSSDLWMLEGFDQQKTWLNRLLRR